MARQEKSKRNNQSILKLLPFERINYILFGVGALTLILGYVALSSGKWDSWASLNLGPVLLVLGYCVIFPLAILYKKRKKTEDTE